VRRLAREAGVDLAGGTRTGPHGRASAADVSAARQPGGVRRSGPSALLSVVEVDVSTLVGSRPGHVLAFVAEAAVRACAEGSPEPVHLAVGRDGDRRPVVHDARDLTVDALARRLSDPASSGPPAGAEPTLTVVDVGDRPVLIGTSPLTAGGRVLTVGAPVRRPVVRTGSDGQDSLAIRSMAYLALSHDEAVLDAAGAGRLLASVKDRLESWGLDAVASAVSETPA
jgi:pyruvate/2-oxoglutarate dehydrogenase complex dihydrolipoamide acyltransferase (E2) component